jgi:hypothetical protein
MTTRMEDMSSYRLTHIKGIAFQLVYFVHVTLEENPQQGPSVPFPEPITALDYVPCMFLAVGCLMMTNRSVP